jgi:hypothetical protein
LGAAEHLEKGYSEAKLSSLHKKREGEFLACVLMNTMQTKEEISGAQRDLLNEVSFALYYE